MNMRQLVAELWKYPLLFCLSSIPLLPAANAAPAGEDGVRGERVGWARLKTPDDYWKRHSGADPVLMKFLRERTSLNIDPTWYAADVENLGEMCRYPLLFAQRVDLLRGALSRGNLAEYIRRGGFLLVDTCINHPDPDERLANHRRFFSEVLPEAKLVPLAPSHPIYAAYFDIPGGRPPHTYFENVFDPKWEKHGLYALQIGPRLAGIFSLSGLQCGWDRMSNSPGHDAACMRMLVNIYIHAMLRAQ